MGSTSLVTLPDPVLQHIGTFCSPLDRLRLQASCRRFRDVFAEWSDMAIEIRSEDYGYSENSGSTRMSFQFPMGKAAKTSFHVKLTDPHGRTHRIRTTHERSATKTLKLMLGRLKAVQEMTLWDACLTSEFSGCLTQLESVRVLRLWNCSRYFEKKSHSQRLIRGLVSLPRLHSLLLLDSSSNGASAGSCRATFAKALALRIRAPLENLQITGMYLPLKALEVIADSLAPSLKRLAIGCTFGKECKRLLYLRALMRMPLIADLDLPPFIFHLGEIPVPDGVVQRLLDTLPLKALGFRHYNSSVLFRFIEHQLPLKVRVLRIYHNANRIPNFAQLGQEQPPLECEMPEKKSSTSSRYSILSTSRSSIGSNENNNGVRKDSLGAPARTTTTTAAVLAAAASVPSRKESTISTLATRRLTIFAIEEAKRRTQRLRRWTYANVDVIYTQETQSGQEVLGRMAEPMRSPHVYSKSAKREMRVIKGDLVRPIPLQSLGMESDYEDWDD